MERKTTETHHYYVIVPISETVHAADGDEAMNKAVEKAADSLGVSLERLVSVLADFDEGDIVQEDEECEGNQCPANLRKEKEDLSCGA